MTYAKSENMKTKKTLLLIDNHNLLSRNTVKNFSYKLKHLHYVLNHNIILLITIIKSVIKTTVKLTTFLEVTLRKEVSIVFYQLIYYGFLS